MQQFIDAAPGIRLWTEQRGAADAAPLLLVMGAQASGVGWPEPLVDALAAHHRVIRYDHRDTGRSTWSFDEQPYRIADLADDVIAVLDGLGIDRAHIVGMSLGGMLAQMVLADHPDRLLSATLIGTMALSTTPYTRPDGSTVPADALPGVAPEVLELWARPVEDHGAAAEVERRIEHWRVLAGGRLPFDEDHFRAFEHRVIAHTGHHRVGTAHGRAADDGMLRTDQLAENEVPALVVSAPAEPVFPPPHPQHLAQCVRGAELVEIPGMGHALPPAVHAPLTSAILARTGGPTTRLGRTDPLGTVQAK
ncbi:alpha/beta fold hydrolase [Streptomyces sp. Je 1-4]|uniref:alpha/beta fold hydrolase n=1 Tax=Streptomyces TaxID=1883 RepID=UPI0021D82EDB|nr:MULTISPECIES: alpha/beta hydrolase [unclassified Streptomyces]UYB41636.1 alpha/beta fold hydrolase [Streptomyces sp. Je 1-4]UZQ37887.1 alpha/beta fold hydrolase [Streptomyces sp. Je 1-4] [Streptomyces sp. Je 1-4 4N24]UZQ45304.1 alpha/beta fold hydrolase [Streptomyces sp. Je 1-4] [Streptomyces sp. Je 1-4 4N24_ara]